MGVSLAPAWQKQTPPDGDNLVWSPTNSTSTLLDIINGAQTSLILESEEMSDPEVIAALVTGAGRGLAVKVAITTDRSWASAFTTLANAGVQVATYAANAPLYIQVPASPDSAALPGPRTWAPPRSPRIASSVFSSLTPS